MMTERELFMNRAFSSGAFFTALLGLLFTFAIHVCNGKVTAGYFIFGIITGAVILTEILAHKKKK